MCHRAWTGSAQRVARTEPGTASEHQLTFAGVRNAAVLFVPRRPRWRAHRAGRERGRVDGCGQRPCARDGGPRPYRRRLRLRWCGSAAEHRACPKGRCGSAGTIVPSLGLDCLPRDSPVPFQRQRSGLIHRMSADISAIATLEDLPEFPTQNSRRQTPELVWSRAGSGAAVRRRSGIRNAAPVCRENFRPSPGIRSSRLAATTFANPRTTRDRPVYFMLHGGAHVDGIAVLRVRFRQNNVEAFTLSQRSGGRRPHVSRLLLGSVCSTTRFIVARAQSPVRAADRDSSIAPASEKRRAGFCGSTARIISPVDSRTGTSAARCYERSSPGSRWRAAGQWLFTPVRDFEPFRTTASMMAAQ